MRLGHLDQAFIAGVRHIGRFRPYGLKIASDIYQMYPADDRPDSSVLETYRSGLGLFKDGRWDKAVELLKPVADVDSASQFLIGFMSSHELSSSFDGVIDLATK